MKYFCYGATDTGRQRELNEDSFAVLPEEGVFVVADGMGGHNAGEVASRIAIETIVNFFKASANDEDMTWPYKLDNSLSFNANKLQTAIRFSNKRIYRIQLGNTSYTGMGTTIVSMLFDKASQEFYVAHVGDSRCYCYDRNGLRQVTVDHSLVNEYIKTGQLTLEQAKTFPHKNVIMRALGMKGDVDVEIHKVELLSNQIYLCCSDGLSDMVPDERIEEILAEDATLEVKSVALIAEANKNGGKDNITVVLFETKN